MRVDELTNLTVFSRVFSCIDKLTPKLSIFLLFSHFLIFLKCFPAISSFSVLPKAFWQVAALFQAGYAPQECGMDFE